MEVPVSASAGLVWRGASWTARLLWQSVTTTAALVPDGLGYLADLTVLVVGTVARLCWSGMRRRLACSLARHVRRGTLPLWTSSVRATDLLGTATGAAAGLLGDGIASATGQFWQVLTAAARLVGSATGATARFVWRAVTAIAGAAWYGVTAVTRLLWLGTAAVAGGAWRVLKVVAGSSRGRVAGAARLLAGRCGLSLAPSGAASLPRQSLCGEASPSWLICYGRG